MDAGQQDSLVVAIDYYDGEAEGFARVDGQRYYFIRLAIDDARYTNRYASIAVDPLFFDEIAALAGAVVTLNGVFVYSGSSEKLNRILDEAIPELRARLKAASLSSEGSTYLESIKIRNRGIRS